MPDGDVAPGTGQAGGSGVQVHVGEVGQRDPESLGAEDGAYRVDEDEGHGPRHLQPIVSADGDKVIYLGHDDL